MRLCCRNSQGLLPSHKNVCFGVHRQGLIKFVGVTNTGINVILWILLIIDIIRFHDSNDRFGPCGQSLIYLRQIIWAFGLTHCVILTILDVILILRSAKMETTYLRVHFYYTLLTHPVLVMIIFVWFYCKVENLTQQIRILMFPYFFYKLYVCWLFHHYIQDILFDKNFESGYRDLLDDEIKKFEDGDLLSEFDLTEAFCLEQIHNYRYKKEEYEIPYASLDFSDAVLIGSGQYGSVYKLNLTQTDKHGKVSKTLVAVKTIDPKLSDVNCFLALLKEAKLMTYMGKHQYIVDLIGICTSEIRKRSLYIVSELCSYGNLQSYLRSERSAFIDLNQSSGQGKRSGSSIILEADLEAQDAGLNTNHLIRWCYEIASGMEYLESRKTVHSDLAARNILLNSDRTVKITDFGLSRRLYSYSVYVKKQNVPLPWKWLAIEALVDLNFSSMSDVWSYGVTCWEIFELGRPPWTDYKVFSAEFVEDVKNGVRMGKPTFCNEEIFNAIISPCWQHEPAERPNFSTLMSTLKSVL